MKKVLGMLSVTLVVMLAGCGQSIEGEYKSTGGKVGIYEMKSMKVQKVDGDSKYIVTFEGNDKVLKYEKVEFKDGELRIYDKGFLIPVKIDGSTASTGLGGATFEKTRG